MTRSEVSSRHRPGYFHALTPLLATHVPAMTFDYVGFDMKLSEKPHRFYRVRQ